jgi:uncharacterized membrane protein
MPRYELTALAEPAGSDSSFALDLNDGGNVAGGASFSGDPSTRAVAWLGGAPLVLDTSSVATVAHGIAVDDRVVGVSGASHAMLWDGGQAEDLHVHFPGKAASAAYAINGAGSVACAAGDAYYWDQAAVFPSRAAVYDASSGNVSYLDPFPGEDRSAACTAINEAGHAAGLSIRNDDPARYEHVFVFDGKQVVDWGATQAVRHHWNVVGVNAQDTVTGWRVVWRQPGYDYGGSYRILTPNDFHELPELPNPGSRNNRTFAQSINDDGVVVGVSVPYFDEPYCAFVDFPAGSPERGIYDLNKVTSNASGWQLEYATGINNAGEIVGYGTYQGRTRGFLLRPHDPGISELTIELLLSFVQLIGGIPQGGGGVGILPGGKPIPVDPPSWRQYSSEQRDILLASILRQLAPALSDENQDVLRDAADEIMKRVRKRLDQ